MKYRIEATRWMARSGATLKRARWKERRRAELGGGTDSKSVGKKRIGG
jgi:hypothetical protein